MGDYDLSSQVINVGKVACKNKSSAQFARLCNNQGANMFDLNRISDSRRDWETAVNIRRNLNLELDVAVTSHNLGGLETGAGNFEEALINYNRAVTTLVKAGDAGAKQLASTYLGIGRCYSCQRDFTKARHMLGQAEQLFVRTIGQDKHFMVQ
jgi:tetratricopeptide (TPR) repeat protein